VKRTSPGRERADFYRFARAIGVDPRSTNYRSLAVACARFDRLLYRVERDADREAFDALVERIRRRGAAA
jgi:hypothetical protein